MVSLFCNMVKILLRSICFTAFLWAAFISLNSCERPLYYHLSDYGVIPDTGESMTPALVKAMEEISEDITAERYSSRKKIIFLKSGRYDFYQEGSLQRELYISNHDQTNPKSIAFMLENLDNIVLDGKGSELVFHGRMLPVAILRSENVTLKNFSVDFENPHIIQVEIVKNDTVNRTISYRPASWVEYRIENDKFVALGEGWEMMPYSGIAFDRDSRMILPSTGDISVGTSDVIEVSDGVVEARGWYNPALTEGTIVAMRGWDRPAPAIFLYENRNTVIDNIIVHYAEGMGLLAQMCENILLDGFCVALKGDGDPRYFTTQADATHFSGCSGTVISRDGLYEGMMDDAINVHGTYLKIERKVDKKTLLCRYVHHQSYGFGWGCEGDSVQFIKSRTMDILPSPNIVRSITPEDAPVDRGVKLFRIEFASPLPDLIPFDPESGEPLDRYGVENLSRTPEVLFENNIVRNNRARGALFSTPRKTVVRSNLFDHTSGSAILLCGDCNGWYETGSCRDITITGNRFVNALTSLYQFTNAVISVYPEIPDLQNQKSYFHSEIRITDNIFETHRTPLLYAKSVDGLLFKDNEVIYNEDFPPLYPLPIKDSVILERVIHYEEIPSRNLL